MSASPAKACAWPATRFLFMTCSAILCIWRSDTLACLFTAAASPGMMRRPPSAGLTLWKRSEGCWPRRTGREHRNQKVLSFPHGSDRLEAAQYDLIVAGAGPAGSACAITAARAARRCCCWKKTASPAKRSAVNLSRLSRWDCCMAFWKTAGFNLALRSSLREYFWMIKPSRFQFLRPRKAFRVSIWTPRFLTPHRMRALQRKKVLPSAKCSVMRYFTYARREIRMLRAPS